MFVHQLTVINKNDYSVQHFTGYWYGKRTRSVSKQGADNSNAVNIVIDGVVTTINNGDYVIKGYANPHFTNVNDLEDVDYVTVQSIDINDVGSRLDNTVLSCV